MDNEIKDLERVLSKLLSDESAFQELLNNSKYDSVKNKLISLSCQLGKEEIQDIPETGDAILPALPAYLASWIDDSDHYDEIFISKNAKGAENIRPAYQKLLPIIQAIEKSQPERIEAFATYSFQKFQKDNRLYHIPRLFTKDEFTTLYQGVQQRACALQQFLLDHYSDNPRYIQHGIIQNNIIQQILQRSLEKKSKLYSKFHQRIGDRWGFWYGPDLIRGPSGQFYVCEDNLGYVGGMGDLVIAQELLLSSFPEYSPALLNTDINQKQVQRLDSDQSINSTYRFYYELAEYYKSLCPAGEIPVLLHYPRRITADNEERRIMKIFRKFGILSVPIPDSSPRFKKNNNNSSHNNNYRGNNNNGKDRGGSYHRGNKKNMHYIQNNNNSGNEVDVKDIKLKYAQRGTLIAFNKPKRGFDHGVYLQMNIHGETIYKKVGLVIIDAEPFDVDPSDRSVRKKAILDEANGWIEHYEDIIADIDLKLTTKLVSEKQRTSYYALKLQKQKSNATKKIVELKNLILNFNDPYGFKQLTLYLRKNHRHSLKESLNSGVKGLLDCYYLKKVNIINGPGFEFLGDKLLCTYVDSFIQFYLNQTPILNTIPTRSFVYSPSISSSSSSQSSSSQVDERTQRRNERELRRRERQRAYHLKQQRRNNRNFSSPNENVVIEGSIDDEEETKRNTSKFEVDDELLRCIFDDPRVQNHVVVKRVDGRGGDSVWVGPKITRDEFLSARDLVLQSPEAFIVQQYLPLSVVDGQLVDLRILSNVTPDRVIVSKTFWGRGVPLDNSNGKVNISDHGFEFTLMVAK